MYEHDLVPLTVIFGIFGVSMAILELVGTFLALSFAAQISRHMKREAGIWTPGEDVTMGTLPRNNEK